MRKVLVFLAVMFAVAVVGNVASADDTNQAYKTLFNEQNICKHCAKDKCDSCKPKCDSCKPKCAEPCAPKCEPCEKKCCAPKTCTPQCEPCKPKCNPCKEWEYPNPCNYDDSEMGRNGLSRRGV
jgi:hypothetical protein